ncbi:MAG TPA: AmmeMemoRadiSam system protein B [Novimethylophilus sp.]|uniref:AmmeMemoRadiSam system protein B n=1 Tax=Novimethylophilus sp. TaxID=2137426 RepID=UPI002F3ECE49
MMTTIRPAAVAGMFYPSDPAELAHQIQAMLMQAQTEAPSLVPKALIAPHAGYIYSGPVAASAYTLLAAQAGKIRRVILLGPTHRVAVRGLALPGADAFETPLGRVDIDLDAARLIAHMPQVTVSPQAHALEHSLEVQLPFLQTLLPDFKLLPLAVGMVAPEDVAEVLEALWGGPETLIVISSDLSHYLPYASAKRIDGETADAILHFREPISHEQACGGTPVNGLMLAARRHGMTPHLLDLRNSGDTAGDKNRVVGYAAFAFTEDDAADRQPARGKGEVLLALARNAITQNFGLPVKPVDQADWLNEPGATFVTLMQHGELRGCMGSLEIHRSLRDDVQFNAVAAALRDPRFPPLAEDEVAITHVEVSLLSPQQPIHFSDEADALAQLRPHIDGVVFEYGRYRSTFLPQVWEQLPQPRQFMAHLKRKAGLPQNFWSPDVKLYRYTVEKWKEYKDG